MKLSIKVGLYIIIFFICIKISSLNEKNENYKITFINEKVFSNYILIGVETTINPVKEMLLLSQKLDSYFTSHININNVGEESQQSFFSLIDTGKIYQLELYKYMYSPLSKLICLNGYQLGEKGGYDSTRLRLFGMPPNLYVLWKKDTIRGDIYYSPNILDKFYINYNKK
ncbi:MAG: hypothetical protein EPN82_03250 [Bacteroidetes bacterium]|nr:MAG: hypothetical protein EPN82_03250 [Bacteroidota bacterium]